MNTGYMDRLTPDQRRRNMQAIRSTNTKIEVLLGKSLWTKGYRYRKNDTKVFGKPDFTFRGIKLAIFCDSEFWHGKEWDILSQRLMTNRKFWVEKIERNIARDIRVNEELKKHGWTVLRFWEKEIKNNLDSIVATIEVTISSLRS